MDTNPHPKCCDVIVGITDLAEPVRVWFVCAGCGKIGLIPSFSYARASAKAVTSEDSSVSCERPAL
jgi:ApbE superfamily uncharacterized protein (UPF0280 family)